MKKLILLTLLSLLGGCVSYYQPETALEDGVYYPEDDPAYVFNSSDYSGVIVYPWSSLDYFYMSYGGFYGHRFAYGYPYGWGYSPFGYPYGYYGHRRAWHFASYYDSYRWPYRGHLSHPGYCPHIQTGDSYDQRERYAGNDGESAQDRDTESDGRDDYKFDRKRGEASSVRRYVTTAPPGYSGNQGMVVRNNANKKTGSSHHLEPSKSTSAKSSSVNLSSPAPVVRPAARTTSTSGSGTRMRSPSVSRSSGRQSSAGRKSARRRDRD